MNITHLLSCLLFAIIPVPTTLYICENQSPNVVCPSGYVLKIISAFYGRKDLLNCPGITDKFTSTCGIDATTAVATA